MYASGRTRMIPRLPSVAEAQYQKKPLPGAI